MLALALAASSACTTTSDTGAPSPGAAAGDTPTLTPGGGTGARDAGASDADALATSFRVAHLTPTLGPVDFCYRPPNGDAYLGPMLAPPALGFGGVTGYVHAAGSGTFTIALVAFDAHSCAAPLAEAKVTLDAGKRATLAVMQAGAPADAGDAGDAGGGADASAPGTAAGALAVLAFVDNPTPNPASARVRFVHAALGDATHPALGALASSWLGAGAPVPLATEILPMHASTPTRATPTVDPLGYASTPPLPAGLVHLVASEDASPLAWTSAPAALGLTAGSVHTAFVANAGGASGSPLVVFWCDDAAGGGTSAACLTLTP